MTLSEARYHLSKLARKRKLIIAAEAALIGVVVALMTFVFTSLLSGNLVVSSVITILAGCITILVRASQTGFLTTNERVIARLINEQYKQYEESTDLLLESEKNLTTLQQLQQFRTLSTFNRDYQEIRIPNGLKKAAVIFLSGTVIALALWKFSPSKKNSNTVTRDVTSISSTKQTLPPSIKSATAVITSPAYTGIREVTTNDLNLSVAEGSRISWTVEPTDEILNMQVRFGADDSIPLKKNGNAWYGSIPSVATSTIYQISWAGSSNERFNSDYYKIEVKNDHAPVITIENLPQFTSMTFSDRIVVDLKSTIADDYGLSNAHIVATVSKGSGEAIKFREEKLLFSVPQKIQGRSVHATRTIDLKKLGMGAGDELYFYVEALDNKTPSPNRTRTETFFVALKDTASQELSVDAGLGVDLMPEYFRSQRQIIIDTEKLLRDRKKITSKQFKATSNELGYDQKVLRLKYGEFLGEEFESGMGPSAMGGEAAQTIEEAVKQYGHTHDTENEHNLVEDKKAPAKEHHHEGKEGEDESPLEAFAHNHDNAEASTFFILSIRAKLKAALTVMWDAELYLRVYEPKKSLPFQYEALRLLKEISNDSRAYVHRTGFDPPPIKEESRLKGDLKETKSTSDKHTTANDEKYPALRTTSQLIEKLLNNNQASISQEDKAQLQLAGNELSGIAIDRPGEYLKTLSLMQQLIQDKVPATDVRLALTEIQRKIWNVLPPQTVTPQADEQAIHDLDRRFIENLTTIR